MHFPRAAEGGPCVGDKFLAWSTPSLPPSLSVRPSACVLRGHAWIPRMQTGEAGPGGAESKWCPGEGAREEVGPEEEPNTTSSPAGEQPAPVSAPTGTDAVASVRPARHLLGGAAGCLAGLSPTAGLHQQPLRLTTSHG